MLNLGNRFRAFFEPIMTPLVQFFWEILPRVQRQPPVPSSGESGDVVDSQATPEAAPEATAQTLGLVAGHRNVDLATIMLSFCLASSVAMVPVYMQVPSRELPTAIHVFSLAIVLAFSSFFVSELISSRLEVTSRVLKRFGMFLTATAFFVLITIRMPSYLKIIIWFVYAISFLAILVRHCF